MAKNIAIAYSMKKKKKKGKVESDYSGGQKRGPEGYPKYQEQAQNEKGINKPVSGVTAFPGGKGTSRAGSYVKETYGGKPLFSGKDHPAKEEHRKVLKEMKEDKTDRKNLAKGGKVQWGQVAVTPGINAKGVHKSYGKTGTSDAGILIGAANKMHQKNPDKAKYNQWAKDKHKQVLDELKSDKGDRRNLAKGGEVTCPHCAQSFSHGGEIANDTDMSADMLPNEFDELVLSGGLEADDDIVKRAMKKKYK